MRPTSSWIPVLALSLAASAIIGGCQRKTERKAPPTKVSPVQDGPKTPAVGDTPPPIQPARAPESVASAFEDAHGRWRSGERLSALVHDAGDGATRLSSWWDRKLRTRCELTATHEGEYCLPLAMSNTGLYSDENCTKPVHPVTDPTCAEVTEGALIRRRVVDPCGFSYAPARVASKPHPSRTWAQNLATGQCVGGGKREISVVDLEPVALDQFVAAEPTREPTAGELEAVVFEFEDGARQVHGAGLTKGPNCHEHGFEPARHCVPTDSLFVSEVEFLDDACEERGVIWYPQLPEACEQPSRPFVGTLATSVGPANCYRHEIHEIVRELKPREVYAQHRGTCGPTDTDGRFFLSGDLIEENDLPRFDDVRVGEGRIVHIATGERGQSRPLTEPERWEDAERGHYVDTERDANCVPRRTVDGGLRCFPERAAEFGDRSFSDPQCEHPLVLSREDPCNEPGPEVEVIVRTTPTCDARVYAAFEARAYEGPVYQPGRKECVERKRSPGETYYEAGAPIELSAFGAIVEVRAPAKAPDTESGTGTG